MNSKQILIVGSGFAGLTLAIFLQRSKIPFRLFEASEYPTDIGGSVTIFPNAMKILKEMGIHDQVIHYGARMTHAIFHDRYGRHMVNRSMGSEEIYSQPTITIQRSILHRLLREHAERLGVKVEYSKKLVSAENEADFVRAKFQDQSVVEGRFLVGADGIHSLVRDFVVTPNVSPRYSGLVYYGGFVTDQRILSKLKLEDHAQYVSVGPVGFFAYSFVDNIKTIQSPSLLWYCYLSQEKKLTRAELDAVSDQEVLAKVKKAHVGWHDPIQVLIENTSSLVKASVSDMIDLPRWFNQRMLLIGDAAHGMNPIAGQGAASAMEDARMLVGLIEHSGDDIASIFNLFQKSRHPRVTKISKKGRRSSELTMVPVGGLVERMRNLSFSILMKITPDKKLNWSFGYDVSEELKNILRNKL